MSTARWMGVLIMGAATLVACAESQTEESTADAQRSRSTRSKRKSSKSGTTGSAMPFGEIRLKPQLEGSTAYEIDRDTVIQVLALAGSNAFPVTVVKDGYRVDSVPKGSVLELGGLKKGDVVKLVNAKPILDDEMLADAHRVLAALGVVSLSVERDGETMLLVYQIAQPPAVQPAGPEEPAEDPTAEDDPPPDDLTNYSPKQVAEGIRQIGKHTYEISPKVIAKFGNDKETLRKVRILPEKSDNKIVGIRVYGIRSGSLLALLGVKNGDRIERVNGIDVSTPSLAIGAYEKLRKAEKITVRIVRNGKTIALRYRTADPKKKGQ